MVSGERIHKNTYVSCRSDSCGMNNCRMEKFSRTGILNGKSTGLLRVTVLMKKGTIGIILVIIGNLLYK